MTTSGSQPTTSSSHDPLAVRQRARRQACQQLRRLSRLVAGLNEHIAALIAHEEDVNEAADQLAQNGLDIRADVDRITDDFTAWSAAECVLEGIERQLLELAVRLRVDEELDEVLGDG